CFSKRPDASLRSPSFSDVRWMLGPIHVAASIRTRVVSSATSEPAPPMTPAMLVGPLASSMTTMSASSVRATASSVSTCSLSLARHAVDAQAVRAVGRDLELEDVRGDRQDIDQWHPRDEPIVVEYQDPSVIGADPQLILGQDHALRAHATQLGGAQGRPVRHD